MRPGEVRLVEVCLPEVRPLEVRRAEIALPLKYLWRFAAPRFALRRFALGDRRGCYLGLALESLKLAGRLGMWQLEGY
jgi:hypothetical protein